MASAKVHALSFTHSWEKPAAMCWVVLTERLTWQRTGRSPANSWWGTNALCPVTHKELNAANKHINELRSEASQSNLPDKTVILANTSWRPRFWPTETMIYACYFKPLSFRLMYYDGIINTPRNKIKSQSSYWILLQDWLFIFFTAQESSQAYKISREFSSNSSGDKGACFDWISEKSCTPP